jgi:hypothetical protein
MQDFKRELAKLKPDIGANGWLLLVWVGRRQKRYYSERLTPVAKLFRMAWKLQRDTAPWPCMAIFRRGPLSDTEDWGHIAMFYREDDDKTLGVCLVGSRNLRAALQKEAAMEKLKKTTLKQYARKEMEIELF